MATLPNPNPVLNSGTITYGYQVDPSLPLTSGANNTNIVNTQINTADINMTKFVDQSFTNVGSTVLFTIVLKNTGNVTATNVVVTDTIPNNTTFKAGSVFVNFVPQPSANPAPPTGVTVSQILANQTATITFNVTVDTIPTPNPFINNSTALYNYNVNPTLPNTTGGRNSNSTSTQVNNANIQQTKYVNKANANVGDQLQYMLVLRNVGNVAANNVKITDTIPNNTSFIPNSLFLNTVNQPGANPAPPTGFTISSIAANSVATVIFNVLVLTIPNPNPIPNNATATYTYTVVPTIPNGASGSQNTNTVTTLINNANLTSVKTSSPAFVKVGDTINYSITYVNNGSTTANNVVVTDTIPNDTTFTAGTVFVNSVNEPTANPAPPTGVNIGNIPPGGFSTITFSVTVNTIPSPNPIPNNSTARFNFVVDPVTGATVPSGTNSNATTNQVNNANLSSTKTTSRTFAKVGDIINYTIVLRNIGNVAANNVRFIDTIPNDTTLVTTSVFINNSFVANTTPNPPAGLSIGTIAANSVATVTFSVVVNTIPNPNPIPNNGSSAFNFTVSPTIPNGASGNTNTNQVNTQVNQATIDNTNGGGLVKSVDKAFAKVGDVLTYTITLRNTGNVTASNVIFSDTIPNSTSFVTDSVFVNNNQQTGANPAPPSGVSVGNIPPGSSSTVRFSVTVTTIPTINPIPNNSTVRYNFTIDPALPNGGSGSGNSNQVTTLINQPNIDNGSGGLTKLTSKTVADVGDVIQYTIVLKNTGNATANSVVFTDTIPTGTTFVTDTVFLNGANQPGVTPAPPTGVTIGTMAPNSVNTITFNVTVNTIPNPNPIPNNGTVNYNYTVDPAQSPVNGGGNTNTVNTLVQNANFSQSGGLTKYVDLTSAKIGDTLLYTIVLKNTGNVTANSVTLIDTIPNGTSFVPTSLKLNGNNQPSANPAPPTGFNLGSVAPNQTQTVTFNVTINSIPNPNPIPNQGVLNYTYTSGTTTKNGSNSSNQVFTTLGQATIDNTNGGGLVKYVDNRFAKVGDILTYTITLKNTGNVSANNVFLSDTIPSGTSLITNTITVNNNPVSNSPNPPSSIPVGTIGPGSTSTVIFQVRVTTIPTPNPIPNNSTVNYNFLTDSTATIPQRGSGNSNQVTTQINQATIDNTNGGGMVKYVSQAFGKVGDTIQYRIVLKNTGNVAANNVVFTDTIPTDTTFVTNSVRVNTVQQIGANPAPPTGVTIGTIAAGGVTTITFDVTVNTIPNPNPIPNNSTVTYNYTIDPSIPNGGSSSGNSNQVTTQINQATIDNTNGGGLVKQVDFKFAKVGDVVTYTLTFKNTGNVTANSVVFTDTIPTDTSFVPNSVTLNGSQQTGANPAPPTGVSVGSIAPNQTSTLTFKVTILTIPNPNPIPNSGTLNYKYTLDPALPNNQSGSGNSNIVTTQVNQPNIDNTNGGGLVKYRSKAFANVGDVIKYTIVLKNTGNVTANSVLFTDTIPNGTSFVTDTVFVNNVNQPGTNPAPGNGVSLGDMGANTVNTITFDVTVNTIPSPNPIPNNGTVNYNYFIDPNGAPINGGGNTNTVTTQVNNANFGENGGITKYVSSASAKVGDVLKYTIVLKNTGNVTANNVRFTDTIPSGTSYNTTSFTLNSQNQPGANPAPPSGFTIGNIPPGAVNTITFDVTVTQIPNPNPIPNQGILNYTYVTDPTSTAQIPGSNISNQVFTTVGQANIDNTNGGGMVKTVDKQFAQVGDILTYSITLKNTGNVSANNVLFSDTIPNGTTLLTDSITVDNNPVTNSPNPPSSIPVGTIGPGAASTVIFKVRVNTVPSPNPIPNNSTVNYTFLTDSTATIPQRGSGNSNRVNTQVNQATIDNTNGGGMIKYTSKNYAKVGDTIQYTIVLKNTGNVAANNVVLTDTIPNDTTFKVNSVILNGTTQPGANPAPPTGVTVGTIQAGSVATVVFDVTVNTVPSPNPIPNNSTVTYNFTIDPSIPNGGSSSGNSNRVTTQVNQATIDNTNGGGLVKAVDKQFAKVGDVLTYTLSLKNTGNVTANNVVLIDTIPNGTSFINNTLTINTVTQPNITPAPPTGSTIGNIPPGTTTTVTFQVLVITIPTPNPIPNNGSVRFTYTIDPSLPNGQSGGGNSNTVNTQINQGAIDVSNGGMIKYVDKTYANVNDTLLYTIVLTNKGNVTANNIVFTDTIPTGTSFITDTLKVNNVTQFGISPEPPTGVNVGSIAPLGVTTILFNVRVTTIPSPNPIPNAGTISYNYQVDPNQPAQNASGNSNIVNTRVNNASFNNGSNGFTKYVDKTYAKVGDVIKYTLVARNTGNVAARNVVFTDTIPNDTTFAQNSVRVNGTPRNGQSPAPPTGISIGTIPAGQVVTINFDVVVNTIPSPNPIPNTGLLSYNFVVDPSNPNGVNGQNESTTVTTQVNQGGLNNNDGSLTKLVDKAYAQVGDVLNYTIVLSNKGNVDVNNIVFTDTIPNGTTFVQNSLKLNSIDQPGANPAPPSGFNVGSIAVGNSSTITFSVLVNTVPSPNPIPNAGTVNYTFTLDPANPNGATASGNTNIVNTRVNQAIIDNKNGSGLVKTVDKAYAKVGDTLLYSIVVKNTGNVTATNVVFTDTIPNDTTFVPNTVTVNGQNQGNVSPAPPNGVTIPSIAPFTSYTITFNVRVNTIPCPNPIPNNGTVNYNFTIDPSIPNGGSASGNTNTVVTQVNQASIDNTNGGGLVKLVDKSYAQVGDVIKYTLVLKNTGNVSATNVILTDTIPNNTSFITGTVFLNSVQQPSANPAPPVGVGVGIIPPGQTSTVTFNVRVNTIPSPNPIPNDGTVTYRYTVDPALPNNQLGSGNSNRVNTQVNQATIDNTNGNGLIKYTSKKFANIGDTIEYTITLKNTGNVTANNVIFSDTIPPTTQFVTDSVRVNNVPVGGVNPQNGVNIGSIAPGSTSTVIFNILVITVPSPNPIPNSGTANFKFTIDPAIPDGGSASGNTNTVTTQVNSAIIDNNAGLTKSVDKQYAKIGDQITYFIGIKNTGVVTALNVVFTDTIPNDTTFLPNSVRINNVQQPGANPNPPTGVNVGNIGPGRSQTLSFTVTVNTIPNPNPIPNAGSVRYSFIVDPTTGQTINATGNTNIVNTQVNQAVIDSASGGLVKYVSRSSASLNDTLLYTIVLTNKGNVAANSVVLTDTIPNGTTFVTDSVFLNDVRQNGVRPDTGINIGSLQPGTSQTVTFNVVVTTVPSPNPIPNSGTVTFNYTLNPGNPNGASGSGNTNIVTTNVSSPNFNGPGGITKYVNTNYASLGDLLVYTIVLKNQGTAAANNVILTDTIPNGATFVAGSARQNGTPIGGDPNPPTGLSLNTIAAGAVVTIIYNATVTTIPNPNPMPNSATINYSYTEDPTNPNGKSGSANSNTVNTQVSQATIDNNKGLTKSVDKAYAKIGDKLTYTINVSNTGNVDANNVIFSDTIPKDTTFVINSVTVDNVTQAGVNPQTGVSLGTVSAGTTKVVTFAVTVNTIPNPNPIPNNGTVSFRYTVNPSIPNGKSGSGNTNTVTTQVNEGSINVNDGGFVKRVDRSFSTIGETILYTLVLKNTGNVPVNNVVVTDTIPNGTEFVPNSVDVNGTNQPGVSPAPGSGVNIGTLNPQQVATIRFSVLVTTNPNPNPIPNAANVSYAYTLDPSVPNGQNGTGNSNIVTTLINTAKIASSKLTSTNYAQIGDKITYTIVSTNTGTITANNVTVFDTLPNGTSLVSNSVRVNGVPNGGTPQGGIIIGSIGVGRTATVTFDVTVTAIPTPNPLVNSADTSFSYSPNPAGGAQTNGRSTTNNVNTTVSQAILSSSKAVDVAYTDVGGTINYTINYTNSGNVDANNIILLDTIPVGGSYVPNTLTFNGQSISGNPSSGVNLGTLAAGTNGVVTFQVVVNTLPTINPMVNNASTTYQYTVDPATPNGRSSSTNTNSVRTTVNNADFAITKAVSQNFAKVGDVITYTINLSNYGNVQATNVVVEDILPDGAVYVPNSLLIGNVNQNAASISSGINVGTVNAKSNTTIVFNATVSTIPNPNPIVNKATVNFNYKVDPASSTTNSGTRTSNSVSTQVNQGTLTLTKAANTDTAIFGDTVTYTLTLTNTGNVACNNVLVTDVVPNGATFVTNTVTINGIPQAGANPNTGIPITSIAAGAQVVITFQALVGNAVPSPNPMPNKATTTYNYTVNPNNQPVSGTVTSNTVNVQVNNGGFDPTKNGIQKSVDKKFATVGDILNYTITLKNTGNVPVNNVILTDTIPNGTQFVQNSVTVNSTPLSGVDPSPGSGVPVGTINPNATAVVAFQVRVVTIPNPNPIVNKAVVNYNYNASPSRVIPGANETNGATTQINAANLSGFNKAVDLAYADVGDIVTYTITASNNGNVVINNVIITDPIPNGTTFVNNSVTINGTTQSGLQPQNGISLGSINPGASKVITFAVRVTQVPVPNPIQNAAAVSFNYILDPTQPPVQVNGGTNTVTTQVNDGNLSGNGLTKAVDKQFANVGDNLTYTITLRNTGNVPVNNVIVTDTIPNGTAYLPSTLTVDGVPTSGTIASGINIGTIQPNQTKTVVFQVNVLVIPNPNPIPNQSIVNYQYQVNPNNPPKSETGATNIVTTKISNVNFNGNNFVKTVDKQFAGVGDIITYTLTIKNAGNVPANNVKVIDLIPSGTQLVTNSVTLNGVSQPGANPNNGITISSINAGSTAVIVFSVLVLQIPTPNPIPNSASLSYTYTSDPNNPNGETGNATSNTVNTTINNGDVSIVKAVDKGIAKVGDNLRYTFTLSNTGNIVATNVTLTDAIPAVTSFVVDSVYLNGINLVGVSPASGINIGSLQPGTTATVYFDVTVNLQPATNPIQNTGSINYNFTIDPIKPTVINKTATSNRVSTVINSADLTGNNFTKSVNKANAKVGDELTYTINLSNTGNIDATNVILTDPVPSSTQFIQGSVTINGSPSSTSDITSGIPLGTIAAKGNAVVTFRVKVISIPVTNPISNVANVTYSYTPDPSLPPVNGNGSSNPAKTTIVNANIDGDNFVKSVDKSIAKVDDILTYTVVLKNTGNVTANNVVFQDPIPLGTVFVANSLTVNGAPVANTNPAAGVQLPAIAPNGQATVVFRVRVTEIPTVNPIPNKARVDYTFQIDSTQQPAAVTNFSNTVTTLISDATLSSIRKAVDKTIASVNDLITYTVTAKNTGNITANNVTITDDIPNGTQFVSGSVTINGSSDPSQNPANGITTGDLGPGQTVAITFKVRVTTIPAINPIPNNAVVNYSFRPDPNGPAINQSGQTNTVTTQINAANVGRVVKSVDLAYADVGDIVTYTVSMTNSGNVAATNTVLTDPIPAGTQFVSGSVTINGAPNASASPGAGIPVGTINPNQTITVVFKVKILQVPAINPIPNTANVTYNYSVGPNQPPAQGSINSNTVTTQVNNANMSGSGLTKVVDLAQANTGSNLSYTITFTNTGNVPATNVILTDPIPNGTTFVPNSVAINGANIPGANPASGLSIGTVLPNQTVSVFFQVKVVTVPSPNPIPNRASLQYSYNVNPTGTPKTVTNNTNTVFTTITTAVLSDFTKSVDKANAQVDDILTYSITLRNSGNTTAQNITIIDPTPNGTQFITGTIFVNGIGPVSATPDGGIPIPDLAPGASANVTYQVKIVDLPVPNPIPNTATANFTFIVNNQPVQNTATSNTVFTAVNDANIDNNSVVKTVDKTYADFDEVVSYTVSITNTGNVTANNVIFTDAIPVGTTFVANSVTVNGATIAGANPGSGVTIPNIAGGKTTIVQFSVKVNTAIPLTNPIPNKATVNYSFTYDPQQPQTNGSATSNTVFTQVASGQLVFNKSVDRNFADIGDELVYTVTATNIGTVNAQSVVITDIIPNGTLFKDNSLSINGVVTPGVNPTNGVDLGIVSVGNASVITFRVIVTTIPVPNPIPNSASGNYNYSVNPTAPNKNASGTTNIVYTQVNNGNITPENGGFVKYVDKNFAKLGDVVSYTIVLKNKGNVAVNNVLFSDTIPVGTVYSPNTLTLNNSQVPGGNPQSGVTIGTLAPNAVATVSFKVTVVNIPQVNPMPNTGTASYSYIVDPSLSPTKKTNLSNTVFTKVNSANIDPNNGLTKAVDKAYADIGDTLVYTITIRNTGNVDATNVIVKDTVPSGTSLVPGSVTVNGAPASGDINSGITIPVIPANTTATLIFNVTIPSLPSPNPIPNSANIGYNFIYDPSLPAANTTSNTNIVYTQVNSSINPGNGDFVKIVDKTATNVNGIITYTLRVKNSGNVNAIGVVVTDVIPDSTTYVSNSLTVDSVPVSGNPASGINLGTMTPGLIKTISFKVKVINIPSSNKVTDIAQIKYSYTVNPDLPPKAVAYDSNEVTTNIFYGDLALNKDVDKSYAQKGDLLTYTMTLRNTGNTTINNVIFKDTIPNGTTFVANSVSVNGTPISSVSPQTGINVSPIGPNAFTVITFQVNVNNTTNTNGQTIVSPVLNNSTSTYAYNVDGTVIPDSRNSNQTSTIITFSNFSNADGSLVKTVDKAIATLGDVLTYGISLSNTGNATALNSLLKDPTPNGTVLVPNSLTVNGTPQDPSSLSVGLPLGNIAPSQNINVIFKVTVTTLPTPNPIPNTANLLYSYVINPAFSPVTVSADTNTVNTLVNYGNIDASLTRKSVDKSIAAVGDQIFYTITFRNTGNITVNNVVLSDTIPSGTTLVSNSVSYNGVILNGANPSTGVNIGDVPPNSTQTLLFAVTVISIPAINPIPNSATLNYSYTPTPNRVVNGSSNTNIVTTKISSPVIDPNNGDLVKSADRNTAQINDIITYSVFVRNSGNLVANNVIVFDSVPNNTVLIPNTATVNGTTVPGSIDKGINVGDLIPNQGVTVTFKAQLVSLPDNKIVENFALLNYSYTLVPNTQPVTKTVKSNTVNIITNSADFTGDGFVKYEDKDFVAIGDTLTYTLVLKNKGNIPANDVVFIDTVPNGTALVQNSVVVNGSSVPNGDTNKGVYIGTIAQGSVVTVSFKVDVVTLPTPNPIPNQGKINYTNNTGAPQPSSNSAYSNIVFAKVNSPNIIISKSGNPSAVIVGDKVTYTLKVTNLGNEAASNLIIRDRLAPELEFLPGTLKVNNILKNESIINGVNLGVLPVNGTATITFEAKVIELPASGIIPNQSSATFSFILDPSKPAVSRTVFSNVFNLIVKDLDVELSKKVDKSDVKIGEEVKYTVTITNKGNVDVNNFIFIDELPDEFSYIPGSFEVDGRTISVYDIRKGVNIGTIPAGKTVVVTYKVIVNASLCGCKVTNKAYGKFKYQLTSHTPITEGMTNIATADIIVACPNFKQMSIDGFALVPKVKPDIEEINDVQVDVNIISAHVIKTVVGTSDSGQNLTGYKAVITGQINGAVEYTALVETQSVHSFSYRKTFSTFIILPESYQPGRSIDLRAEVENVDYEVLNTREVYTDVTFMITGSIL